MSKFKKFVLRTLKRMKFKFVMWERGHKLFKAEAEKSGHEKMCGAICRALIKHPDSKFSIAPLSEKKYIINETLDIFVVMVDRKIEITNHVYHYIINMEEREMAKLKNMFDGKLESIRVKYENDIKSQIDSSLSKIFEKVTEDSVK
jgi:hypothetical protein